MKLVTKVIKGFMYIKCGMGGMVMDKNYKITRHVCPRNCYSSCAMLGYTRNRKLVKVTGDKKHGYTNGKLCPKGYNYLSHVYHPDRLKYPMIQSKRGSGEWNRISWDEAIDIICHKIIELYDRIWKQSITSLK